MSEAQEYLLGSADDELARLEFQHRVWQPETGELLSAAGLARGMTVLDLGCGPGLASLDIADRVGPDGRVIGVDNSRRFLNIAEARAAQRGLSNLETSLSEAEQLEGYAGVADVVFSRWLLCFLERPQAVVTAAAQCLRPGGRLAVFDYFNYLAVSMQPTSDIVRAVFREIRASFEESGGNLEVGGNLPRMMIEAGLTVVSVMPICRTGRPGSDAWQWVTAFLRIYLPGLVDAGRLQADVLADFEREWQERQQDPAAFFFTPPMVGVVGVRS